MVNGPNGHVMQYLMDNVYGKQNDGPPLSGISIYKYIFIKINLLYKMSIGNVFY